MTHSLEQISKMTKVELTAALEAAQAAQANPIRVIPAVPAVPAVPEYTDEKGIKHDAVAEIPAVPARSITDQLLNFPQGQAYTAACKEIDAANETAQAEFTGNEKTKAIQAAKDAVKAFTEAHKETFAKIDALNSQLIAENDKMKGKNANMKAIKAEIKSINAQIDTLEATLTYPSDYDKTLDLSFEELPTFTPVPYPSIDTFFPNGISGNFPASFLIGDRKNPSQPKTAGANKAGRPSGKNNLPENFESEVLRLHALGKRNTEILTETGTISNNKVTATLAKHGLTPNVKA